MGCARGGERGEPDLGSREHQSCSNYCHGQTLGSSGGTNTAPVWTTADGTQAACHTCHATTQLQTMRISKGGGTPTAVATSGNAGVAMAVDATNVYFYDGVGLSKAPLAGGFAVQLVSSIYQIGTTVNLQILVDGTNVYYTAQSGAIFKVPINPPSTPATPTALLPYPLASAGGMALTSTQLAFIANDGNVYLADK
jgi:predicted CxxxxCH...CXXCH cytochrome family protein